MKKYIKNRSAKTKEKTSLCLIIYTIKNKTSENVFAKERISARKRQYNYITLHRLCQ